jgi:tripartite-type tricarboxylate transporter receptor subunit TctC
MTSAHDRLLGKHDMLKNLCLAVLLLIALPMTGGGASAATYPEKPIRIVVEFAPGGGADFVARLIGTELSQALKQSVVVENKPGANGAVADDFVAKANPDGYTLLLGAAGPLTIRDHLQSESGPSPLKRLAAVALVAGSPFAVVVDPSLPVKTLAELTAYAKAHPGKLNYGSSGVGGSPHLATELYAYTAGLQMQHVPYKGLAPALVDLIGGHIDLMFADVGLVKPYLKDNKLRVLAVTGANRSAALPDVPTIAESGLPGYQASTWYGLLAPAQTPPAIIATLNEAVDAALRQPETQQRLVAQSLEAEPGSAASFATFIDAENNKWAKLIQSAHLKTD